MPLRLTCHELLLIESIVANRSVRTPSVGAVSRSVARKLRTSTIIPMSSRAERERSLREP